MNTTYLSIQTEEKLKAQVELLAAKLGVSVTDLVTTYLKQLVKDKSLVAKFSENPTPYLIESIRIAQKERKAGKTSPLFDDPEDAIAWLNS